MFITDRQTQDDLNLFSSSGSIYQLYNHTHTQGGAQLLEEMFRYPMTTAAQINGRSQIIRGFVDQEIRFPFAVEHFDIIESYLQNTDERSRLSGQGPGIGKRITDWVAADPAYREIYLGVAASVALLQQLRTFTDQDGRKNKAYQEALAVVLQLISDPAFSEIIEAATIPPGDVALKKHLLSYTAVAAIDTVLRFGKKQQLKKILQCIYQLDVYLSVARVARRNGFAFASAIQADPGKSTALLTLEGVFHPGISSAKGNSLRLGKENALGTQQVQNTVFLTGANMAGKSTFMKAVGIAVYVAHIGFPVAAGRMDFTVMDGFFSTINLPDNLGTGASHFYAEVLRVKKIAQELKAGKRLFVLFDELFRGTNVRDAHEATVAIVEGFTKKADSLFMISTHIIEAGADLEKKTDRIQYLYLPTRMEDHQPVYTYQLEKGITADRHGMIIIRQEGILEMLADGSRLK